MGTFRLLFLRFFYCLSLDFANLGWIGTVNSEIEVSVGQLELSFPTSYERIILSILLGGDSETYLLIVLALSVLPIKRSLYISKPEITGSIKRN